MGFVPSSCQSLVTTLYEIEFQSNFNLPGKSRLTSKFIPIRLMRSRGSFHIWNSKILRALAKEVVPKRLSRLKTFFKE